jgi:hypothetical protein
MSDGNRHAAQHACCDCSRAGWVPWPNGIITTNMFRQDCFDAVTNYALHALPQLVAAGMDGIFLE